MRALNLLYTHNQPKGLIMTYDEYIKTLLSTRGRHILDKNKYTETHHIIPRCMGGSDDEENLIDLFPQEHYLSHKLLAEENPDNSSLLTAWFRMCYKNGSTGTQDFISSEEYSYLREKYSKKRSEIYSGENNPFYGKHHSEETKDKIRKSIANIKHNNPQKWAEIHEKRSFAHKGKDHSYQIECMRQANLKRDYTGIGEKISATKKKNNLGNNRKNKVKITDGKINKFVLACDVSLWLQKGFYIINQAQEEKYIRLLSEIEV